ncbi:MAG: tetratricopeptide repeat protein [Acidobacteria bacterium]|nr:tetratricopeptide repeat protein [Acidobacteriota bacterium]
MTHRFAVLILAALSAWSCAPRHTVALPAGKRVNHNSAVAAVMRRQAVNAQDAGDGDLPARRLRQRVLAAPDDLAARLELARHYERAGSPELAAEHYRLAAVRFPDHAGLQVELARLMRDAGLAKEAESALARFLDGRAAHRDLAPAWSWLGILRDGRGDFKAAEQAHRSAVQLQPEADSLHNNLGYNLLLQGRHEEAAGEFRRALALRPDSRVARNNLGLALASQPKEALAQWRTGSDPATAHNNMAAVLIEQRRFEEARRELDIALGYKRDHPAALRNLQLVSELDGRAATVPAEAAGEPRWKRSLRALGRVVAGIDTRVTGGAPKTASR